MRLYEGEFVAFFLGAALAWACTFYVLSEEKRKLAAIKRRINFFASYHDLSKTQFDKTQIAVYARTQELPLARDYEILDVYKSVTKMQEGKSLSGQSWRKLSSVDLTAEIVICEKLLGLTYVHALRVLLRLKTMSDLPAILQAVKDELVEENSN